MNEEFEKFHGNFFSLENKIFDKLTDIVYTRVNKFPKKVIACLVRTYYVLVGTHETYLMYVLHKIENN